MRQKCVIFDLDGTLTDSGEGITKTVVYVCEQMGFDVPPQAILNDFVGPPLRWSFHEYVGMTEEEIDEAHRIYRRRYDEVGIFQNRVYPGVPTLLRMLKEAGCWVAVATGKPEQAAIRVADHFGFHRWLDRIVGTSETRGPDKVQLIREALPEDPGEVWMVGDRKFDIEGGRGAGAHTVGVGYGYGAEEELRASGCDAYAATVDELIGILCPAQPRPRGAFIAMEGLDGCGKSTQIESLTAGLRACGYEVEHSREPGGCPISEKIREVILDPANQGMTAETEALLYAASRAQHVRERIRPALAEGKVLLCDRFVDSSIAYQGGGRQLGVQRVLDINAPAVDGTLPDVTVLLRLDHRTSLARRAAASALDRMEMETEAFFARVEAAYDEMAARQPERFVVVDADRSPEVIAEEVLARVLEKLAM